MKRLGLFVSAAILSISTAALASESIRVYEAPVTNMPLIEARFKADVKRGEAYIEVYVTNEAPEHMYIDGNGQMRDSRDDMEMVTVPVRAPFPLVLDSAGNIIVNNQGVNVVCATVKKKHFLFVPYTKVSLTGNCKLDAFTNSEDGRETATVDLIIK